MGASSPVSEQSGPGNKFGVGSGMLGMGTGMTAGVPRDTGRHSGRLAFRGSMFPNSLHHSVTSSLHREGEAGSWVPIASDNGSYVKNRRLDEKGLHAGLSPREIRLPGDHSGVQEFREDDRTASGNDHRRRTPNRSPFATRYSPFAGLSRRRQPTRHLPGPPKVVHRHVV